MASGPGSGQNGHVRKRRAPTRRAGSGDNHEARIAILEHRFPETLQARCSTCGEVARARDGEWREVVLSAPGSGIVTTHVFRCNGCDKSGERYAGSSIVAVPRQARGTLSALQESLSETEAEGGDIEALPAVEEASDPRRREAPGLEDAEEQHETPRARRGRVRARR